MREISRRRNKIGVSQLIATMLLVVIVVAGAALIYAYMVGFIGNVAHVPSVIQITGFCASSSSDCDYNAYQVTIDNIGSNQISGSFSLTFSDSTHNLGTGSISCFNANLAPDSSITCYGSSWDGIFPSTPVAGDELMVTVVASNGGTAFSETQATT